MLFEASWLPVLLIATMRRPPIIPALPGVPILLAEIGRRRDRGRAAFQASSAGWAALWVLERAVTVWIAIGARLRGGAGTEVNGSVPPPPDPQGPHAPQLPFTRAPRRGPRAMRRGQIPIRGP